MRRRYQRSYFLMVSFAFEGDNNDNNNHHPQLQLNCRHCNVAHHPEWTLISTAKISLSPEPDKVGNITTIVPNSVSILSAFPKGIGRALCEQLYKCGAKVYAFSRSPEPLDELVAECPTVVARVVDLGDWDATVEALASLKNVPIYGLVNNAGIAVCKPFLELTQKDFDE